MVLKGNKKISLTEREYDTAKNILKDFPNKDLEKQVKESETENQKNQLEAKLNDLKKSVSDSQKQLDGKNKQISDLQKQLDDINKGNDKDKGKHSRLYPLEYPSVGVVG
ncbi:MULTISPECIES: hypothetical protein [Listeria]|uniref:hypothetical protein n=1 Tax=Listeria TaxID=1637 RepID=UPI00083D326C|nr:MULTISPECIES: hypothetical protein [Listeria]EHJ4857427.1 hypothetical protein [Listeria monocytogenes]EHN4204901.1 hypothetical protein [Listeria monocytogenes]EHQ6910056.1 hypothetical protein [Listeria monocytogenes]EHR3717759.1 hypothetical protein [Listeria monocytogenes]EHV0652680.1 hypothetical protein [Listeria monocytogenes]